MERRNKSKKKPALRPIMRVSLPPIPLDDDRVQTLNKAIACLVDRDTIGYIKYMVESISITLDLKNRLLLYSYMSKMIGIDQSTLLHINLIDIIDEGNLDVEDSSSGDYMLVNSRLNMLKMEEQRTIM